MNDMEKCFYEPAELSVVDEGKGNTKVKLEGSVRKLGFLVTQAADSIFKNLSNADAVDVMENAIACSIHVAAMRRKSEIKNEPTKFEMSGGFNAIRNEGMLQEILKSIFGKQ